MDNKLKMTMEAAGIGVTELAYKAGVTAASIYAYFGGTKPNLDTGQKIAAVLGCSTDDIWPPAAVHQKQE